LEQVDANHTKMKQVFLMPNGQTYESGHTTEIQKDREISVSFTIMEEEWTKNRTYTWNKQSE
jgi:hypothetical protein